jgi:hypothetical protein
MPTESNAKDHLDQMLAHNTARLAELVEQQYNVEITRSVGLFFSSPDEECAKSLIKALFAKGTRVLSPQPEKDGDLFRIRVGVKRSLRDSVREEFTKDMVETAAGMNGQYDGWDLLSEDSAEQTQTHTDAPDMKSAATSMENPQVY